MYLRYVPSAPLNSYIRGFFYHDATLPFPRERILPVPWLTLIINFGGPFRAYEGGESAPFVTCVDSWWIGLRNVFHVIEWPDHAHFLMVDFKPGGVYPFLQMPIYEFHQQVVALDQIWGRLAAEIRDQLLTEPTMEARFARLERLLLARLSEAPHGLPAVQYALDQISRAQDVPSIRVLSDEIGMSQKHLIEQFKRFVGGTPKEVARMFRLQHALHCIDLAHAVDWTQVAHECLYYDQSHFNKDFEAFIGSTPGDYLRIRRHLQAEHPQRAKYLRHMPLDLP